MHHSPFTQATPGTNGRVDACPSMNHFPMIQPFIETTQTPCSYRSHGSGGIRTKILSWPRDRTWPHPPRNETPPVAKPAQSTMGSMWSVCLPRHFPVATTMNSVDRLGRFALASTMGWATLLRRLDRRSVTKVHIAIIDISRFVTLTVTH